MFVCFGIKPAKLVNTSLKVGFLKRKMINLEIIDLTSKVNFINVFMESFDNKSSLSFSEKTCLHRKLVLCYIHLKISNIYFYQIKWYTIDYYAMVTNDNWWCCFQRNLIRMISIWQDYINFLSWKYLTS